MALSVATNNVLYPRLLALVVRKLHDKDPCAINSDFTFGRRRSTNDTLKGYSLFKPFKVLMMKVRTPTDDQSMTLPARFDCPGYEIMRLLSFTV